MTDLSNLILQRETLKGQLNRHNKFISKFSMETNSIHQLEVRLANIERLLETFNNIQIKIELENGATIDNTERDKFETNFY